MSTVRYSVHYEDYSEHLSSRFGKLLQMQLFVDTTLMCSSHTLRVHKAVLAASSPYFQDILEKQTGEPLIIMKMQFGVLKSLVEFMYCGRTNCMEENLEELVAAAQFLKIKGLSKVSREGLGGKSWGDLPEFSPPIVINQPADHNIKKNGIHMPNEDSDNDAPFLRPNVDEQSLQDGGKELVVRIPIDMQPGMGVTPPVEAARASYYSAGGRGVASRGSSGLVRGGGRARRGRPRIKHRQTTEQSWGQARQPSRAQHKRDQLSQKAMQHLHNIHLRDYMDRVTLTQAVDSICGPEASSYSSNYVTLDNNIVYVNPENPGSDPLQCEPLETNKLQSDEPDTNRSSSNGISSTMSQYVNVLKNAGLPTDLPILFESGDGSYINVNEQVLLDMVQSNEIQYEVIEQPDIVRHVEQGQIKSIDDLTRCLEKGEMSAVDPGPDPNIYFNTKEKNRIVPNHLEMYDDRPHLDEEIIINNLESRLTESPSPVRNSLEYNSIDCEMSYFTSRAMKDDIRKYYEEQRLSDANSMSDLCTSANIQTLNMPTIDDNDSAMSTSEKETNTFSESFNFNILSGNSSNEIDPSLDYLILNQKNNSLTTPSESEKINCNEESGKSLLNLDTNVIHDTASESIKDVSNSGIPPVELDDVQNIQNTQENIVETSPEEAVNHTSEEVSENVPETRCFSAKPVTIALLMKQDGSTFKEYRQIKKINIMPAKSGINNIPRNIVKNTSTENYIRPVENSLNEETLSSQTSNPKKCVSVSDDKKQTTDEVSSEQSSIFFNANDSVLKDANNTEKPQDSMQDHKDIANDENHQTEKADIPYAVGLLPCNKIASKIEEEEHSPRVTRARSMHLKYTRVETKRISLSDDSSNHKTKRLRNKENVDPSSSE